MLALILGSQPLSTQFIGLGLNEHNNHVEWLDVEGSHSIDVTTFCCQEIVDRVSVLLSKAKASIAELPGFSTLYQMVTTNIQEYIEQMRGIISCV